MPVWFITLFALCIAPLGCGKKAERVQSVVLIGVDTLRADHLGFYGAKRPTSPILDQFVKQARVFDHAYATSAWTLPSFASLLTGLGPAEHGAGILLRHTAEGEIGDDRVGLKNRTKMKSDVTTLAERLSARAEVTEPRAHEVDVAVMVHVVALQELGVGALQPPAAVAEDEGDNLAPSQLVHDAGELT